MSIKYGYFAQLKEEIELPSTISVQQVEGYEYEITLKIGDGDCRAFGFNAGRYLGISGARVSVYNKGFLAYWFNKAKDGELANFRFRRTANGYALSKNGGEFTSEYVSSGHYSSVSQVNNTSSGDYDIGHQKITDSDGTVLLELDANKVLAADGASFIHRYDAAKNPNLAFHDKATFDFTLYDVSGNGHHTTLAASTTWGYINIFDAAPVVETESTGNAFTAPAKFNADLVKIENLQVSSAFAAPNGTFDGLVMGDVVGFPRFSDDVLVELEDTAAGISAQTKATLKPAAPYDYVTLTEDASTTDMASISYQSLGPARLGDQVVFDTRYLSISSKGIIKIITNLPNFNSKYFIIDDSGMQESTISSSQEIPVGHSFLTNGARFAHASTLGNILTESTLRVEIDNAVIPENMAGMIFSQAGGTAANRELACFVTGANAIAFVVGGVQVDSLAWDGLVTSGPVMGDLAFDFDFATSTIKTYVDGVLVDTLNTVQFGTGRVNEMPFFIGARSNDDSATVTSGGFIAPAGTEFGDVRVYQSGTLTRNYVSDGTNDTWTDLASAQDATIFAGSNDSTQWKAPPVQNQPPTIVLNGVSSVTHIAGEAYTEQGATWTDAEDGTGTVYSDTVIDENTAPGSYTLNYQYVDSGGLSSPVVSRSVTVESAANQNPLAEATTDAAPAGVSPGSTVTLTGSGSSDPDGTIVSYLWEQTAGPSVTITNADSATATVTAPRSSTASTLQFRLTVTDDKDAKGTALVSFDTLADQKPTFVGTIEDITIEVGSTFTPPTFTVIDAEDGDLGAATVTGAVDTNTLGAYTLTYTGPADSNGVAPDPVTLTVNVVDTTAPVITPDAVGDITLSVGDTWSNPTATVTDNYDADRTIFSDTTTLDTSGPTSGVITFTANDSSGNAATSVTQNYMVVADYSDIIETIARVSEWDVVGDGKIRAFKGRSNREVFKFRPSESEGLITTIDGYLDLSAPYFDKIEIKMNGEIIDTTTNSVLIGDGPSEICARLGDFNGLNNNTSGRLTFILYVGGDTRGTVIGSPAMNSKNIDVTVSEV